MVGEGREGETVDSIVDITLTLHANVTGSSSIHCTLVLAGTEIDFAVDVKTTQFQFFFN